MCEWEYKYCEHKGLEFYIHNNGDQSDELMFDVDYKGEFLLLDLGDELEVTV